MFVGPSLDERLWFPHHLAGWSSREASAARYEFDGGYPMQFMLDILEFSDGPSLPPPVDRYPKVFGVDWFRGYRPVVGPDARPLAFRR